MPWSRVGPMTLRSIGSSPPMRLFLGPKLWSTPVEQVPVSAVGPDAQQVVLDEVAVGARAVQVDARRPVRRSRCGRAARACR